MTEYKCIRCLYITKIKTDMVKHLYKLKKCEHKDIDTLNFNDDYIIKNSLTPLHNYNIDSKKYECDVCMRRYTTQKSLSRHNKNCTKIDNISNINIENYINIENLNVYSINEKEDNDTKNEIKENSEIEKEMNREQLITPDLLENNKISIENMNIKNININLVGFDEKWNLSHIEDNLKYLFMFSEYKYTDLLKEILENIINLNVILDKYSEKGFVYLNETKKFESREQSKIIEDTIHKLQEQLYEITDKLKGNKKICFDRNILNKIICDIKNKHNDYFKSDKLTQKNIRKNFIDIFNNKYNKSLDNYQKQKNNFRM